MKSFSVRLSALLAIVAMFGLVDRAAAGDDVPFKGSLEGTYTATPVDPNLEGQFIDEILVGYEYEVMPNFSVGVQASYRELGDSDRMVRDSNGDVFPIGQRINRF